MEADCHTFRMPNGQWFHREFKHMLNFKHLTRPVINWIGASYDPIMSPL